jgi:hypothetical protein
MKAIACTSVVGLAMLLAGCISSLHPFYTEKDVVFDPDLVGCWSQGNDPETWEFSKVDEKMYELVYTDKKGNAGRFDVHLFELEGKRFIDMVPQELKTDHPGFYMFHLQRLHGLMHVKQIKPTLQLQPPNPNWFGEFIQKNPDAIAHEMIDDRPILTASTEALQKFWRKHLETEDAFGDPCDMQKKEKGEEAPGE